MCAHNSELGPGHRSVTEGKAYILRWRKQRQHQAHARVEEHHQRHLAEAIEHGDLYILSEAIEEAEARGAAAGAYRPRATWLAEAPLEQLVRPALLFSVLRCPSVPVAAGCCPFLPVGASRYPSVPVGAMPGGI